MRELNSKLFCIGLTSLMGVLPCCGGSSTDSTVVDASAGADAATGGFGATPSGQAGSDLVLPPNAGSGPSNGGASATGGAPGGGVYMLPPDFTMTQMGGYKLGPAIDVAGAGTNGAGGAGGAGGGSTGSTCGTQILGVVRDFKGANEPNGHPDFEAFSGSTASLGIVNASLGMDQKPVYSAMGPFIDPANKQQTTSKANFDQWYRATPDVNKPYIVYFYFEPNGAVLTFQSDSFFPLDDAGWGNTCAETDANCKLQDHNFGFTTEVHTQFSYKGKETFAFTGDDDLWVFINHTLAIDLGGLHSKLSKSVLLDDEADKLGIEIGKTYDLDLFHAERHTSASTFRVDTNLAFTNCGTIIDEPPIR